MEEFAEPWNCCLRFAAGGGDISKDGTPLESAGFGLCYGFSLHSVKTLETAAFHVNDIEPNYEQRLKIRSLSRGEYVAVFSCGGASRNYINLVLSDSILNKEGIVIVKTLDIKVPSGRTHWDFVVYPSRILINVKSESQMFKYKVK